MKVIQAELKDMQIIMHIIDCAKQIMRSSGNLTQWSNGYPNQEVIASDIAAHCGFLCIDDNDTAVAYFAAIPSPDPTYNKIYEGQWIDDNKPYIVVHRIASSARRHGVFDTIIDFCASKIDNLRIDTHRDNHIMQHCLSKRGFSYCGIIHLQNGDERLAYQLLIRRKKISQL